jgi:prepilin-type N-terminal cleavage/methylation domain-containing protein
LDISRDNKGASLLELIIAMMIAAIILSMIFLFINSASKGFRKTNDNVNLQIEAQTIINQLSNLVM